MSYPPRLCAICDNQTYYDRRVCNACEKKWKSEMDSAWVLALIEAANEDYNHRVRAFGREIPLDWLAS